MILGGFKSVSVPGFFGVVNSSKNFLGCIDLSMFFFKQSKDWCYITRLRWLRGSANLFCGLYH